MTPYAIYDSARSNMVADAVYFCLSKTLVISVCGDWMETIGWDFKKNPTISIQAEDRVEAVLALKSMFNTTYVVEYQLLATNSEWV